MSKAPPPQIQGDFDSPDYDVGYNLPGSLLQPYLSVFPDTSAEQFSTLHNTPHQRLAYSRAALDAVEACVVSGLVAVAMVFPRREDHSVTRVSIANQSWDAFHVPEPSKPDSWLRAAMPELPKVEADSYLLQQFLRSSGTMPAGMAAAALSASSSSFLPGAGSAFQTSASSFHGAKDSGRASPGGGSTAKGASILSTAGKGKSVSKAPPVKVEFRRPLSADHEAAVEQLRQEVVARRQQAENCRLLAARDEEERARLQQLRRDLKGRDYSYDHKGSVVVLANFDPEKSPLEVLQDPSYRVQLPVPPEPLAEENSQRRGPRQSVQGSERARRASNGAAVGSPSAVPSSAAMTDTTAATASSKKPPAAAASRSFGIGGRGNRDRQILPSDFKKTSSRSQPSAMDTMVPVGGVTLRQGNASKMGPQQNAAASGVGVSREAYNRMLAKTKDTELAAVVSAGSPAGLESSAPSAAGGSTNRSSAVGGDTHRSAAGTSAGQPSGYTQRKPQSSRGESGPLAEFGARVDPLVGAKPRVLSSFADSFKKPPMPDMNLALTSAADWGAANVRSFDAPPSLPVAKPTAKVVTDTVGRADRLPRDRTSQATLSPPRSQGRAAKDSGRLQFRSFLSEPSRD